jgi:hypothetical protein
LTANERDALPATAFEPEALVIRDDDEPDCRAVHPDVWAKPFSDERRH